MLPDRRTPADVLGRREHSPADGFVLTGGLSSRMGRNKAVLPWRGGTLLEHVASQLVQVTGRVRLVGAPLPNVKVPFETIPDAATGCGPIGGIVAALRASRRPWALISACDLPNLDWERLAEVVAAGERSPTHDAVVPADRDGGLHPLCALYHQRSLPVWEAALASGTLRLQTVLSALSVQLVPQTDTRWLTNVNTPAEWQAVTEETA